MKTLATSHTHIVVTSKGGLIEAVSFYKSKKEAIASAKLLWRDMDYEADDCKVFPIKTAATGQHCWRPESR